MYPVLATRRIHTAVQFKTLKLHGLILPRYYNVPDAPRALLDKKS